MVLAEVNAILIGLWGGVLLVCIMTFVIIMTIVCFCGCVCLLGGLIGATIKSPEQEEKEIKEIKGD